MQRLVGLVFLAAMLGGCVGSTTEPVERNESTQAPKTPALPMNLREWTLISHDNESVALRARIEVPSTTTCSFLFAVHHRLEFRSDGDLYILVESSEGVRLQAGGRTLAYNDRVNAGGVNTRPTSDAALNAAFGAFWTAAGYGRTFTTWRSWTGLEIEPGSYNVTLWSAHALDGGQGETSGGSAAIAVGCDHEVTVQEILEDREPAWLNSLTADGSLDIETAEAEVHEASYEHETPNATLLQWWARGQGFVNARVSGALEESFDYAWSGLSGSDQTSTRVGPPGKYRVDWTVRGMDCDFEVRILSFTPLPLSALQASTGVPQQ